ncbi:hypothetical protein D3C79_918110 [compost metagenome]
MKRNEIDIIKANSCTGTFNAFNGFSSTSMPSVIEIGDVVRVKIDVIKTNTRKRTEIKIPCRIPSS